MQYVIILILLIITLVIVYRNKQNKLLIHKLFSVNKIAIIGHRGTPKYESENTISSFKTALEHNADGIELDVQITKDKKLIIFHDKYLFDNISTINLFTKKEVKEIFNNAGKTFTKLNDIIPLLDKINILNIEIKSNKLFPCGIEELIVQFIEKHNLIKKTIVSAFNPLILRKVKLLNKNIYTGYLFSKQDVPWFLKTYHWGKYLNIESFHPDIDYVNKKMVRWAKERRLKVVLFTVNSKAQYNLAESLKADGIFTDNTKMMVEKKWLN